MTIDPRLLATPSAIVPEAWDAVRALESASGIPENDPSSLEGALENVIVIVRNGSGELLERTLAATRGLIARASGSTAVLARIAEATFAIREERMTDALRHTLEARSIATQIGNESLISRASSVAATVHYRSANYVEARREYEDSLVAARRAGVPLWEAHANSGLALVAKNQGDLRTAEHLLRGSLSVYQAQGRDCEAARCLLNLGIVLAKRSAWRESRSVLNDAIVLFELNSMTAMKNNALLALARLSRLEGDFDGARACLREVSATTEAQRDQRITVIAKEYLGDLLFDAGDISGALREFREGFAIAERIEATGDLMVEVLRRLGEATSNLHGPSNDSLAMVARSVELAREQGDRYELACSLQSMGRVHSQTQAWNDAHSVLVESLSLWRELGDSFEQGRSALLLSRVLYQLNRPMDALALAMEAKCELTRLSTSRWSAEAGEWLGELTAAIAVSAISPAQLPTVVAKSRNDQFSPEFLSTDPTTRRSLEVARKLAPRSLNILVLGESGTGKELIAAAIHKESNRKGPFVPVNCSALPGELLEGELFGHARGAYTGAERDRNGLIEYSHKGTLFLDEIGDMPVKAQARLLRALESGEIRRLGENSPRVVDLRVVAATHRNLLDMVSAGEFRLDLYYRLAGYVLRIPPVRDRDGDAAILIDHFLNLFATEQDKHVALDPDLRQELIHYSWPGNVREIRNVMQRIVSLAEHGHTLKRLPFDLDGSPQPRSLPEALEAEERKRILDALRTANGNKSAAARLLGASRTTLIGKMKRLGIEGVDSSGN